MTTTFSVITPSLNSEKYIAETIQSVISQRGDFCINYLVIDGGSQDSTLSILDKYIEINKSGTFCNCLGVKFDYISEPDEGMYDALVNGMSLVGKGDIYSYISSDDFYLPNAFASVMSLMRGDVAWLTGLPSVYNSIGSVAPSFIQCIYQRKYIRCGAYGTVLPHIQQESTFWRAELNDTLDLEKLRTFKYAGDYYMWHTFAKHHELRTAVVQLGGFRKHASNMSLDRSAYLDEFNSISDNCLLFVDQVRLRIYELLFKVFGSAIIRWHPGLLRLK